MGSSSYSDDFTRDLLRTTKASGRKDIFSYSDDYHSGRVRELHSSVDPKRKNSEGKIIRESRDSAEHPNSLAIAILFDTTGSMGHIPQKFVEKLPTLMGLLVSKGYVEHPHILFGAVNDCKAGGREPFQCSQFEAGNEMDSALASTVIDGGGGGGYQESYEMGMYFLDRTVKMDCLEKRGEKGFLFIIGDELPYNNVSRREVVKYFGVDFPGQDDVPTSEVLASLKEKFHVFWIMPNEASHANDPKITDALERDYGQNFIRLVDTAGISELIATTVGVCLGHDVTSVIKSLRDLGASDYVAKSVETSLAHYKPGVLAKLESGIIPGGDSEIGVEIA